jgi:hypothetical protein
MAMPTTPDLTLRYPATREAPRRRAIGATLVAALYVVLVLSTPFIIRYGPDTEMGTASLVSVVTVDTGAAHCGTAPVSALVCTDVRHPASADDLLD